MRDLLLLRDSLLAANHPQIFLKKIVLEFRLKKSQLLIFNLKQEINVTPQVDCTVPLKIKSFKIRLIMVFIIIKSRNLKKLHWLIKSLQILKI